MNKDLKSQLARLDERTEHIITKLDDHRETTNKIWDKLDKLPCDTHKEKIKGINGKIAWIWGLIVIIVGSIITSIGWVVRVMAK